MALTRAYSTLEIKAVDDEQRIIEGIASTPSTDRMDDIVEPMGAKYTLPIPLLWQHRASEPIGHVIAATVTKAGIKIKAQFAKTNEPGRLKDRLDEAWQSVKLRLVRGLSIGFDPIESARIEGTYGQRYISWDWLELSAVTIPANADASILSIKQYDAPYLPAPGSVGVSKSAGVPASPRGRHMTIAERIAQKRAALITKNARYEELIDLETRSADQQQELDATRGEVSALTKDIQDLDVLERAQAAAATQVTVRTDETSVPAVSRQHQEQPRQHRVEVASVPKGTAFLRYALTLMRTRGSISDAILFAKQWRDSTPQVERVLKAAVNIGTTAEGNWAAGLFDYQNMASEFVGELRPQTIVGRLNLRRVPFNIKFPRQTAKASVGWVGQAQKKPATSAGVEQASLPHAKTAGIIVLSDELVKFSNPSAEAFSRQELMDATVEFLDQQIITPTVAPVSNVSPGAITNGTSGQVPTHGATGNDAADLRNDIRTALASFTSANIGLRGIQIVMEESTAVGISLMRNQLGQKEFEGMTPEGGTLEGFPVITSESVRSGDLVFVKGAEIFLADDDGIAIDVSREASIIMDDGGGTAAPEPINLWENNLVGLRVEREIFWQRRRDKSVYLITSAAYGQPT